ncbi:hypothetical protein ABIB68_007766 [Bradyrhizobium sp. F1.2.2]
MHRREPVRRSGLFSTEGSGPRRPSGKPDQANGRANTQRPAIGMNAAPPYVPYRKPETRVSSAVTSPEPNAYSA